MTSLSDIQEPFCSLIADCSDGTELSVLAGFHLFSQLSASPAFTVDSSKSNKIKWCPCGRRHAKAVYGDNSIGIFPFSCNRTFPIVS